MTAVCVMVLGTTSGAGKSWLTTALCRHYARMGLRVAPFKAQNMSNNARVVAPTLHRWSESLPPEGADPPWGGPAEYRVAPTLPAARGALPPEGADPPWGGPAEDRVAPTLPAARGALPPEGADPPWGGPAEDLAASEGVYGEIGSAQYFQALAARAEPEVRMNPVLLKPEADTRSQVVLMGEVNRELSDMPWRGRSEKVWPVITAALDALRAEYDVIVIEGAGSPAEINLHASDIVNMRIARHAQARCLLVTDIDRGGAFAHLYGTWALLPEDERKLIRGFVLNKFRGDAKLLAPGPQMLQDLTGVPTVATLPMWWQHGLPEEDGVFDDRSRASGVVAKTVAVIAYPRISNLDEFQPLKNVPGVRLIWARSPADCVGVDWIILPGSKATSADLAWLRAQGLDRAVAEHATQGRAVLGICGGLQMLGEALIDTLGIEPLAGSNAPGLGLLPLVTAFDPQKTVRHTASQFTPLTGAWAALSGVAVSGYEIHHGQTAQHPAMAAGGDLAREVLPGLGWQNDAGNVLGVYLHGLFEDPRVLQALFGAAVPTLETVFDGLADFIHTHFEPGVLDQLIAPNP